MSNYQEINPAIVKVKNHKVYYLKINLMILHGYAYPQKITIIRGFVLNDIKLKIRKSF